MNHRGAPGHRYRLVISRAGYYTGRGSVGVNDHESGKRTTMARWRPPPSRSSPYITAEGYARLEAEQAELWSRRQEVTRALAAAAAEGDRSENAEYIYRKKELRELDRRIRYLQKRMPALKIVRAVGDTRRVYFGARVTIEDERGQEFGYRLVGPDEIDRRDEYISVDSVMARALLGRTVDETVLINTGGHRRELLITGIEYDNHGPE